MSTEHVVKGKANEIQLVVVEQSSEFRVFLRANAEAPASLVLPNISVNELRAMAERLREIAEYNMPDEDGEEDE